MTSFLFALDNVRNGVYNIYNNTGDEKMTKLIRTDYKGNDKIEMTAVEIEQGWGINKTEYFVDFWRDGKDNTWTKTFQTEAAAHEFMTGLL